MKGTNEVLLIFCYLMVLCAAANAEELPENLLTNGDFEDGTSLWHPEWSVTAPAEAQVVVDTKDAFEGENCIFFDIKNCGTEPWHLMLQQRGSVVKGHTYTFSAWFKAEEDREVRLGAELWPGGSWSRDYGKTFFITTEWSEYYFTFTSDASVGPPDEPGGHVRFIVYLGALSDVSVWVDNVRLYEGEYVPEEQAKAVSASAKHLSTTWGMLKSIY